ncbi:MAG: hypothetical protein AAGE52_26510 [Myxococcota bacterium]
MRFLLILTLFVVACGDDDSGADGAVTDSGADGAVTDSGEDSAVADSGEDTIDSSVVDGGDDGAVSDGAVRDAARDGAGSDAARDAAMDTGEDALGFDADVMACAASTLRFESPLPQMTNGAGDDYDPVDGCVGGFATGPDRVYALVPSLGPGTYRVVVTPVTDDWNPMIYVITDCTGDMCIDGTNFNGIGEADSLDVELEEGEVVYIVVDTALDGAISGGAFTIAAERLP